MAKMDTHPLPFTDKDKLLGLMNALEHFNKLDRDMPLQMIRSMISICIEEGVGPHKVAEDIGVAGAVASRHMTDLGEINRYRNSKGAREEGYNLVEQRLDPTDRRFRKAFLTPKGLAFRQALLRALKG